jgi:hypothetical protein
LRISGPGTLFHGVRWACGAGSHTSGGGRDDCRAQCRRRRRRSGERLYAVDRAAAIASTFRWMAIRSSGCSPPSLARSATWRRRRFGPTVSTWSRRTDVDMSAQAGLRDGRAPRRAGDRRSAIRRRPAGARSARPPPERHTAAARLLSRHRGRKRGHRRRPLSDPPCELPQSVRSMVTIPGR